MTTILVVDDEPLIAMALEAALEDEGYAVVTAVNGQQGLQRLAGSPRPDLVVLDMMMPIMDGPAMRAAMTADPALRTIPVIMLSSLPEPAVRERVESMAAVLRKPCRMQELLSAIEQVLSRVGGRPAD